MDSDQIFDMLEVVANTSGHGKFTLLHDKMKPYLLWAYNPFERFYLTNCVNGHGTNVFSRDTSWILKALSLRFISGYEAQDIVNRHTKGLTQKSALLFKRILKKDLRIGMAAKSINKVFPGLIPIHDVMLAKLFDPKRVQFPCFGGPKIDGIRATYNPETGKFYSRRGLEFIGLDHLSEQLKNTTTFIDGELDVPGYTFQIASGMIRKEKPTPDAVFNIFELPKLKESFLERLILMNDIQAQGDNLKVVHHKKLINLDQVFNFYTSCRNAGYEGAVIRPSDYEYSGTRSFNWMKMKNIMDFDLEVTDLYEGEGKYKGHLGGAIVKYKFQGKGKTPIKFNRSGQKVGGGFSDEERFLFWNSPNEIIGKTIQVVITEFTDDGNFRHARMGEQKIREDK